MSSTLLPLYCTYIDNKMAWWYKKQGLTVTRDGVLGLLMTRRWRR